MNKPHKTKKFNPYKTKRYNLHIPEDMFEEIKPIIKRFVTKKIKQRYGAIPKAEVLEKYKLTVID